MKRIQFVNPSNLTEDAFLSIGDDLKRRLLLGDNYHSQVNVVSSSETSLWSCSTKMAFFFGWKIYRISGEKIPNSFDEFLNKFSRINLYLNRMFNLRYDRVFGIHHFDDSQIRRIFKVLNISFAKEKIEGISYFIAEFN